MDMLLIFCEESLRVLLVEETKCSFLYTPPGVSGTPPEIGVNVFNRIEVEK